MFVSSFTLCANTIDRIKTMRNISIRILNAHFTFILILFIGNINSDNFKSHFVRPYSFRIQNNKKIVFIPLLRIFSNPSGSNNYYRISASSSYITSDVVTFALPHKLNEIVDLWQTIFHNVDVSSISTVQRL